MNSKPPDMGEKTGSFGTKRGTGKTKTKVYPLPPRLRGIGNPM
jgi:hypothetical protein